jgi:hypothetical protein
MYEGILDRRFLNNLDLCPSPAPALSLSGAITENLHCIDGLTTYKNPESMTSNLSPAYQRIEQ